MICLDKRKPCVNVTCLWFSFYFAEKPDDSPKGAKEKPKPVKCTATLISPQLLACKIETNKVEIPPALRQRSIQLQALNANRYSNAELLSPQSVTIQSVDNDLRQRKKAVVVEDIHNQRSGHASSSSTGSDDDYCSEDTGKFETHLVIEFSPEIQKKTLHWIIDKIRTRVSRGGAGLEVRREPQIE